MRRNGSLRPAIPDQQLNSHPPAEMLGILCPNRSSPALAQPWRLAVCLRDVGSSIFIHAPLTPAAEEYYGRMARRSIWDAVQRDSDSRK